MGTSDDHLIDAMPEVLLPSQFFELVGSHNFSSEQRLILAVLTDAINIIGSQRVSTHRKRRTYQEASSWIFGRGLEGPMSFERICDALGVNAESLRGRLSEWVSRNAGTLRRIRVKEVSRMQRPTHNRGRRPVSGLTGNKVGSATA
jgi:hypothetical protein